ncbi:MAG: hypothetical protein OEV92_02560 [Nitrospinota bacterium]|nr:hypothetical protein [Nitrospinota bacterium]
MICLVITVAIWATAHSQEYYQPGLAIALDKGDSVESIIHDLSSKDIGVAQHALTKLIIISEPPGNYIIHNELSQAIPVLNKLLNSSEGVNSLNIYRAMANIGDPSTVEKVTKYARDIYNRGGIDINNALELMSRLGVNGTLHLASYFNGSEQDRIFALASFSMFNDVRRMRLLKSLGNASVEEKSLAIAKYDYNISLDHDGYDKFVELLFDPFDQIKAQAAYKIKYNGVTLKEVQLLDIYKRLFEFGGTREVKAAAFYGLMRLDCDECLETSLYYLINDYEVAVEEVYDSTTYDPKKVRIRDIVDSVKYKEDIYDKYKNADNVSKRLILMCLGMVEHKYAIPIAGFALGEDDYWLYKYAVKVILHSGKEEGFNKIKSLRYTK